MTTFSAGGLCFPPRTLRNAARTFSGLRWQIAIVSENPIQLRIVGDLDFDRFRSTAGFSRKVDLAVVFLVEALLGLVEHDPDLARRLEVFAHRMPAVFARPAMRRSLLSNAVWLARQYLGNAAYLADIDSQGALLALGTLDGDRRNLARPWAATFCQLQITTNEDWPSCTGSVCADFPDLPVPSAQEVSRAAKYFFGAVYWRLELGGRLRRTWIHPGRDVRALLAYKNLSDDRTVARALVAKTACLRAARLGKRFPRHDNDALREQLKLEVTAAAQAGLPGLAELLGRPPNQSGT
jgi:hypothetical protein